MPALFSARGSLFLVCGKMCSTRMISFALLLLTLGAPGATAVRVARNGTAAGIMHFAARQTMEVKLGPFASAGEACDYCFGSFTKKGDAPAGPVAPYCVCMAYPDAGGYTMFCSTPQSSAGYVKDKV